MSEVDIAVDPPRPSFWKRRIVAPIAAQLAQGIAPQKVALTLALGVVLGTFPILGSTMLLCGLAAIPALHGLVQIKALSRDRALVVLGQSAFSIYLLNTIVIGLAKAGYLKLAPFEGASATFALALFFVAGVLVPVLIHRLSARVPVLAKIMR